jgi:hypothetical protein
MNNDRNNNNIRMMAILAAMILSALMLMAIMRIGIWFVAWAVTTIPDTYVIGFTLTLVSSMLFIGATACISDALVRMGRKYMRLYKKG